MELLARAVARHRAGRADEAEALYRLALAGDPDEPNALFMLAALERSRGHHRSAMDRLTRAAASAPDRPDIQEAIGDVCRVLGDQHAALAAYETAVVLAPRRPTAWLRKADLLLTIGATDQALAWLAEACRRCPGDVGLWDLNGVASLDAALYHRAERAFAAAVALAPGRDDLMIKHAAVCTELGRLEQAIGGFQAIRAAGAGGAAVETEIALACFAAGRLDEGWAAYATRWQARGEPPPPALTSRPWDGQLRSGLRLLVGAEQGVGDQIMFAAGLSVVAEAIGPDGKLIIECAPKLVPLFARAWPQAVIQPTMSQAVAGTSGLIRSSYAWIDQHEPIDAITHMADLSRHLLPTIDGRAYLHAEPKRAAHWRGWLASLGAGTKIGVCWRSSLSGAHRDNRIPPVAAWRRLFEAYPEAQFINLQYHDPDGSSWEPACAGTATTIHLPPALDQFEDLDEVAALIDGLDLVISTPTAVAALAGALGRPTLKIMRCTDWSLFGHARSTYCAAMETVQLSREWYGPSAMAPVIAAARARLGS